MTIDEDWKELRRPRKPRKSRAKTSDLDEAWQVARGLGYKAYVLGGDVRGYDGKTIQEVLVVDCKASHTGTQLRFTVQFCKTVWAWPGLTKNDVYQPHKKARWSVLRTDLYETQEAALRVVKRFHRDRKKLFQHKMDEIRASLAFLRHERTKTQALLDERVEWSKGWGK